MSMSDCIKCWDTPCSCGYDYRHWTKEKRIKQASAVLGVSETYLWNVVRSAVPEDHPMLSEKVTDGDAVKAMLMQEILDGVA